MDKGRRVCFVTVGATAPFPQLIDACTRETFLESLKARGYTRLLIQHGNKDRDLSSLVKDLDIDSRNMFSASLEVTGFDFNPDGLMEEMRATRGQHGVPDGVVISHAGSGSILDALRIQSPLIVVPNPSLLDNHQVELAEELAKQGYVVHGQIDNLEAALELSESLQKKRQAWPPKKGADESTSRGLAGVMDDEMGFYD